MTICNCDEFNTDVTFSGNIKLGGAIAKINDRANVGITSNSFDDLINNFDGAAYWFSGTQGGSAEGTGGTQVMKLQPTGNLELGGAIAKINGRANVGITANPLDDLIHNFDGTAYWFSGTQGGSSEGGGTRLMKLQPTGELEMGNPARKVIDAQGYVLYG